MTDDPSEENNVLTLQTPRMRIAQPSPQKAEIGQELLAMANRLDQVAFDTGMEEWVRGLARDIRKVAAVVESNR